MRRNTASLLLSALLSVLLASSSFAKDKWIRLRSPNFEAFSNASEKKSKKLLGELEQFRHVFYRLFGLDGAAQLPVRVMIFKSSRSFDPFKPVYEGKPAAVSGYFQGGNDYNLIAMEQGSGGDSLRVIFHEYVHLLTSGSQAGWPVWLKEGLAEFYSTFRISGDKVILGSPVTQHAEFLRRRTLLPLETLFEVGFSSPEYNERDKKGVFYAQSWALVHFLMMDDKAARRPQLGEFIRLLEAGRAPLEAAGEAFPETLDQLARKLRNYVAQQTVYALTVQMEDIEAARDISVERVAEATSLTRLGDLLLHTGRLDEAAQYYQMALGADPATTEPYEGMGLLAFRRDQHETALELLEKAAAADSANFLVHLYYGQSLMRLAGIFDAGRLELSDEIYEKAAKHLRRAVELTPSCAEAHYLLANLHLAARRDLKSAMAHIRSGLRLKAQEERYLSTLADLQLALRDWKGARETLLGLASGSLAARELTDARLRFLDSVENAERRAETGAAPPVPDAARGDTGEVVILDPPKSECHPDFASLTGAVPLPGRLLRVECESAIIYVVEINGRETRLVGERPDQPVVFSCDVRLETFECGPLAYPVTVFLPGNLPKDETTGADVVRAIELKSPE